MRNLKRWNTDESNPRLFRVQDKGSRLVVEWKKDYVNKVFEHLQDSNTFREEDHDKSNEYASTIKMWANKWKERGALTAEVVSWICEGDKKPGKVYANIKTHKETWPYRFIISCKGTSMENLARWNEYHLKYSSTKHKAYLKDTSHFLNYIEDLNAKHGPFEIDTTKLSPRDIKNFYTNCDTKKCLDSVEKALRAREEELPPTECILEAVKISMSSNMCEFLGRYFTQINGATIGGPDSGSITDLFGAY